MILRVVERRTRPDGAGPGTLAAGTLAPLVDPLGHPGWAVDLVLVDDEIMAGLNAEYRRLEGVTDVLSFSYLRDSGAGEPDLARGLGGARGDLWLDTASAAAENGTGPVVGEIVIAPGFVTDRCRRRGWAPEHEFPLLVVHGALHLLGWDHADEAEAERMRDLEEEVLAGAGLPHPLRERS